MQFCLEHPSAAPQLRFQKLESTDSRGNPERSYGHPCTSLWQEEMEETYFPGGLPDGVDIVGGMHAMDVSDVQMDGSWKSGNFYGGPIGMSKELRGSPDVWAPLAYLPMWKHPDTEGVCPKCQCPLADTLILSRLPTLILSHRVVCTHDRGSSNVEEVDA